MMRKTIAILSIAALLSIPTSACFAAGRDGSKGKGKRATKDNGIAAYTDGIEGVRVLMKADGETDTYALMNSYGYYEEVPDCGHDVRHITQSKDPFLKGYTFDFHLHVENGIVDSDRCLQRMAHKQRNEIKTFGASPDNMQGQLGQTHTYNWKFKLQEDHSPSASFTHIHQVKACGGTDAGMPLITFTTRLKDDGSTAFQLIYVPPKEGCTMGYPRESNVLGEVALEPFLGEWVEAVETLEYKKGGEYSVKIVRLRDNKVLFEHAEKLDLCRAEADFMRPKYGIYRMLLKDKKDPTSVIDELRDEVVRFADIMLIEHKE